MRQAVLDASVFVAACSPAEVHHGEARAMMDSIPQNRPFLVPALFRIEVLAALARRGRDTFFLDAADALITGPRFFSCPLDESLVAQSVEVARRARCRAYDAVYGALALSREAVLLTLDEELMQLLSEAYPAGIGFSWEG